MDLQKNLLLRNQFTEYYSGAVKEQLDSGKQLVDIDVNFRLSTVKPLHGEWLISIVQLLHNKKGYRNHSQRMEKIWDCRSS